MDVRQRQILQIYCSHDPSSITKVLTEDYNFKFKGTGNMELILDRQISDKRIFPAIELNKSGTRREELLLTEIELNRVYLLRNFLSDMPPAEAIEFLLKRMAMTETNKEFMAAMAQGV